MTLRGDGAFRQRHARPDAARRRGIPALDPAESAHGIVRTLSQEDFGAPGRQAVAERQSLVGARRASPTRGTAAGRATRCSPRVTSRCCTGQVPEETRERTGGTVREFDVVVIGAGVAGEVAAGRLGEHGARGGDRRGQARRRGVLVLRLHAVEGAAPSGRARARGRPRSRPRARADRRRGGARASRRGHPHLDDAGQLPWLEERGITLVRGRGRLDGERRVVVGAEHLVARKAVIVATGSRALDPGHPRPARGEALDEHRGHDRDLCSRAARRPRRRCRRSRARPGMVGVRAQVTLVHRGERLIEREEPFASAQVLRALREDGVDVRLGCSATRVSRPGAVVVELDDGTTVEADEVLAAFGRVPGGRYRARDDRAGACRRRSPSATICASAVTTGCSRSATSTAARCSRTWASIRPGSSPTRPRPGRRRCDPTARGRRG